MDFATYQGFSTFMNVLSLSAVVLYLQDMIALSLHKIQNGDLLHLIRLDYLLLLELTFWPELSIFSLIIEKLVSLVGFRDRLWYFHLSRLAISGIRPVSESNTAWPQSGPGGGA